MIREITTRTERLQIGESGIVDCLVFPEVMLSEQDARENVEAVKILGRGRRVPVLVDITGAKGADRNARAYLAGDETARYQSACAMIVNSPFSQLVGSFFLGLNRTKFPVKLFRNREDAVKWLHNYL